MPNLEIFKREAQFMLKKNYYLIIVLFILISCEKKLIVKTINYYDNNTTVLGYREKSVKINDDLSISKFSGGPNHYSIKKITRLLFLVEFKRRKFWISNSNYNTFINNLNFLLNHKDNFRFQINSSWVGWFGYNGISSNTKYMSLDPIIIDPRFNIRLNRRTDVDDYFRNLNNNKKQLVKPKSGNYLNITPGKGLNTPEFRKSVEMLESADAGIYASLSVMNSEFSRYPHNPYWVIKLIPNTCFSQINLSRLDDETIKINGISINETDFKYLIQGFQLLGK